MQSHSYNQGNQPLSFEEALSRLEEIVQSLETGQLSLDETVALYEEGQRLRVFCERKLTEAQQRIRVVTESAQGEFDVHDLVAASPSVPAESFSETQSVGTSQGDSDRDRLASVFGSDAEDEDDPFR